MVARAENAATVDPPRALQPSANRVIAVGAAVAGAAAYVVTGAWRPDAAPTPATIVAQAALVAIVALPFLGLAVETGREAVTGWVAANRDLWHVIALPLVLLLAVVGWAAVTGRPVTRYAAAYLGLLVLPMVVAHAWPAGSRLPSAQGINASEPHTWPLALVTTVVLALWIPVELSLLPPLPRLAPVGVSVGKFVAVAAALWLMLVVRPMRGVGYGFAIDLASARTAFAGFLAFSVVSIPLGFLTGFLLWNPQADVALWLLRPVLIFFTIAVPEEFVFRGVVQRALTDRYGPRTGLFAASVVFGLAHAPNPVYIVLATLAGAAYGWVYHRTGRVAAAALTHALVDAVWVLLLRR